MTARWFSIASTCRPRNTGMSARQGRDIALRQWLDTNLHLLYPERLHHDWTAELPALQHPFHLQDYMSEAQSLGIGPVLHMEADVHEADVEAETELGEELAKDLSGQIVGAIS